LLPLLTASQYREWESFAEVEPFGWQYTELLHGLRCLIAAQAAGSKNAQIEDFCPSLANREQTPDEARATLQAALGAVKKKK